MVSKYFLCYFNNKYVRGNNINHPPPLNFIVIGDLSNKRKEFFAIYIIYTKNNILYYFNIMSFEKIKDDIQVVVHDKDAITSLSKYCYIRKIAKRTKQ